MRGIRIAVVGFVGVAVAAAGGACGGGGSGGDNVGERWAKAVDDERWGAACELMTPRRRCEDGLRRDFGGREVKLLKAGEYQSGEDVTDNRTRFAVEAARAITYFELERRGGRDLVDPKITVEPA